MNLGDVMRELGDAPLKNHTWTTSILNALNAILPSTTLLTEDSTGRQVLQAMALLPDQERNVILTSSVDLIQGTFTLATSSTDGSSSSSDSKSQSFHQIVLNDLAANPSRALMLFFAAVMVIISLILATVMSFTYAKTGKVPDTTLFQALIKALVDILNAFSNTSH